MTCQYCGRYIDLECIADRYVTDFVYIVETLMACTECCKKMPGVDPDMFRVDEEGDCVA